MNVRRALCEHEGDRSGLPARSGGARGAYRFRATMRRLAAWVLAPLASASGQVSVELRLSNHDAFVNEPVIVEVEVKGIRQAADPRFPTIPNCDVRQLESSRSTIGTSLNGRATIVETVVFRYELTPRAAGEVVIPEVAVQVDGRTLTTRPERLLVRPSDAEELLRVDISSETSPIYVGQRARLTLRIWLKPALVLNQPLSAEDMRGQMHIRNPQLFGPFAIPNRYSTETRPLGNGSTATYYVFESTTDFDVQRPGPLALSDMLIAVDYPVRFGRDPFGRLQVMDVRRLRVRPDTSHLEALPLPSEGRPPGFNGAVGTFTVSASVNATQVRVGDPIELTLAIRGRGPLDTLAPPALETQPALTQDFRVPSEQLAGAMVRGERVFTQTLRAKRPEVRQIPSIEYPYFDPMLGAYQVTRTEPIPLSVRPAETLSAADLADAAGLESKPTQPAAPVDALRGIEVRQAQLLRRVAPVRAAQVLAVTATPAAVFAVTGAYVALRKRSRASTPRSRRHAALRDARRTLSSARGLPAAEQARQVEVALSGYVAQRVGAPPASFRGPEALARLTRRGAPPETIALWTRVVNQCEAAGYGGRLHELDGLVDRAEQCLLLTEGLEL
jgi:hypothetical protein